MDNRIQEWQNLALGLLKPTSSQVAHGRELHRDALVIEAYGFAPRPAVDGTDLQALIAAGGSSLEVDDRFEEMIMTRAVADATERAFCREAWEASGVTCILQNAGQEGNSVKRLIKRLARFTWAADMTRDLFRRAATPDDILSARQDGQRCLYLTANGVPLPENWNSAEEELAYVRVFFQLGCRMMHLTYNRRNVIGDGCGEPTNAGLSDFGRRAVAEMNQVGVIVDVAHSGHQTSLDAARFSTMPVVASHSCCAAVNQHIRAKSDDVIRAIANTGGYIGICCVPEFLGGTGDIRAFLDHIDYAIKTFGADHVAIGTDAAYRSPNQDVEQVKFSRAPQRPRWESLWPEGVCGTAAGTPDQRKSMAWTNFPIFTIGMLQRGHSDEAIRKVLGLNVLRVARATFGAHAPTLPGTV